MVLCTGAADKIDISIRIGSSCCYSLDCRKGHMKKKVYGWWAGFVSDQKNIQE